jgi:ribosomal protein S18 acetylase RimI-like enzyme
MLRNPPPAAPRRIGLRSLDPDRLLRAIHRLRGAAVPETAAAILSEDVHAGRLDARRALVLFADRQPCGLAIGAPLSMGFLVDRLFIHEDDAAWIVPPLARALRTAFPGQRVELLLPLEPALAGLHAALPAGGFERLHTATQVERQLVDLPCGEPAFDLVPYAQLGRRAFARLLDETGADGTLAALRLTGAQLMGDLLEQTRDADGGFQPAGWMAARLDGRLVGAVIGLLHPGAGRRGSLGFLGLRPELRGRGLGHALFADALAMLAEAGVEHYVDTVADDNPAMQRVALAQGCAPTARLARYLLAEVAAPERLGSLEELIAYLRRAGVEPETDPRHEAIRFTMRARIHEATMTVRWPEDADFVEVAHDYAMTVAPAMLSRAGLRASRSNAQLAMPGFFVDPDDGSLGFRHAAMLAEGGDIRLQELMRILIHAVCITQSQRARWLDLRREIHDARVNALMDVVVID